MKLNSSPDQVLADCNAMFAVSVAIDLGIRGIQVWTASASGFIGYLQFDELVKRGIIPFKVSSTYALVARKLGGETPFSETLLEVLSCQWQSWSPSRVQAFAWQCLLERLPTRVNLLRRGVPGVTEGCVLCASVMETELHLFLACPVAASLWYQMKTLLMMAPWMKNLDWIVGMKDVRLKDMPSFIRVTNLDDILFNFLGTLSQNCLRSSVIIINTFQELEDEALVVLKAKNPNIYSIGPLHLLDRHFVEKKIGFKASGSSFWKNDLECIKWLDRWVPCSVLYVNYGSITVMTKHHLTEFAWGIANSKFLWIMRPDVVVGESTTLPPEFLEETKDRGYITSWCLQDQVLAHPSVGVFLTHCGWNSTL